jgi:hypothetical protein
MDYSLQHYIALIVSGKGGALSVRLPTGTSPTQAERSKQAQKLVKNEAEL